MIVEKMKYRYLYRGSQPVNIPYVGTFKPGQEYEVNRPINHPDFEEVKKETKSDRKGNKP